ncbi:MAG TPA: hypothetical protein VFX56_12050 [Nitrospira sp.]|nr:hypothetical protein [Nitrospira sp.]
MSLFGRILGIPSFAGSTNALLVELTLPTLTDPQRAELKVRAIQFLQNIGSPGMSPETALAGLNQASRMTQLNVLALAMKELGYKPALSSERLRKVQDPFAPDLVNEQALRAVARRLKWKYGVEASLSVESITFDTW